MPQLAHYGLLTGAVVDHAPQNFGNPHYLLYVNAEGLTYRTAVNLESTAQAAGVAPNLQYKIIDDYEHNGGPNAAALVAAVRQRAAQRSTLTLLEIDGTVPTLDFVRGGILDDTDFQTAADDPDANPYHDGLVAAASQAVAEGGAGFVAVFGTGYDDSNRRDATRYFNPTRAAFGFNGVDNVHMNQGSYHVNLADGKDPYNENAPNQDGGIFFFFRDGTVRAFLSKFESQDIETDAQGLPLHTGVAQLDAAMEELRAVSDREQPAATAAGAVHPSTRLLNSVTSKPTAEEVSGGFNGPNPEGYVFAQQGNVGDPTRPYAPDDDSGIDRTFADNFAKYGVPEPVPGPNGNAYPTLALQTVVGPDAAQAALDANRIVFHMCGDTGAPKAEKLPHEQAVADLMVQDLSLPAPGTPQFCFHLGDVVYFYGEQEYYYDQFYKPYAQYAAPIFAVPGNHDGITYSQDMVSLQAFLKAFCDTAPSAWAGSGGISRTTMTQPGVFFTLDAPLVSIIGLYSNCSETYGYLDQQQKLFLFNELQRLKGLRDGGRQAAILLAVHHPPLSFSPKKPSSARMRDDIGSACQTAGLWPDAVFSGHAHVYQRMTRTVTTPAGDIAIPHVISGSGGYDANIKGEIDRQDFALQDVSDPEFRLHRFLASYGFLRVTVDYNAAGPSPHTLRVDFVSPDVNPGQSADAFVLDLDTHQLL